MIVIRAIIVSSLLLALARPALAAGDPEKGEALAIKICSRCHVIGAHNPTGGIDLTPSFYVMAEKPESYRERVLTMQQRRPHASMDLDLTNEDLADVLAYILNLERP